MRCVIIDTILYQKTAISNHREKKERSERDDNETISRPLRFRRNKPARIIKYDASRSVTEICMKA